MSSSNQTGKNQGCKTAIWITPELYWVKNNLAILAHGKLERFNPPMSFSPRSNHVLPNAKDSTTDKPGSHTPN
jgi:hypothetical protein